jgi:hypothetical protein
LRLTSRLIVDAGRFKVRAMDRKDICARRPLDISSRSTKVRESRDLMRSGGRMPPVRSNSGKIDDDPRSNTRPIELIDSPRCRLSQISDFCLSVKNMRRRYFVFITPSLAKD